MQNKIIIPDSFKAYLLSQWNDPQLVEDVIASCQKPLRKSIRINTLKISVDKFKELAKEKGWLLKPIPWCNEGFWIQRPDSQDASISLGNTAEHLKGLFYIQEASSMLPAFAISALSNDLNCVLDMAAAPGSKTTQLASYMQNQGVLLANELSASRVKVLSANIQRCGVANSALSHFDGRVFGDYTQETFDAILLDAPCSGEGTVRKDPLALRDWNTDTIASFSHLQQTLIQSAFYALKVGGTLVYSTCTLNHWENQQSLLDALQTFDGSYEFIPLNNLFAGAEQAATQHGFLQLWPHLFDSEGFFIAAIRKVTACSLPASKQKQGKDPYMPVHPATWRELQPYFTRFGLDLPRDRIYQRDKTLWLMPEGIDGLSKKIRLQRSGVKLATLHNKGARLTHDAAVTLCHHQCEYRIELNDDMLNDFYQGKDIPLNDTSQGENLVVHQSTVIGVAKVVNGKLKNAYPRELVKDSVRIS